MTTAPLCGTGPMAVEAQQQCQQMQQVLMAVSQVHTAHHRMVAFKSKNAPDQHNGGLHELLNNTRAKHVELQHRHQMLSRAQQSLRQASVRQPQLADL